MTVLIPSFPPYKVIRTRIGVFGGSGRVIAAAEISSMLSSGANNPVATDPPVYCKNLRRVTLCITTPLL
jgi:hypothetical protein